MEPRDCLAADLHDVAMDAYGQRRWAQAPWPTDMYGWLADHLIALGWTRLDAATDLGQQTVVSTALGRRVTEKPLVLHADQCALAPDHGGPCMWVGGRRPEDPVYPNRRAADLRGIVTDPAWAEGHRRGEIDEERLARAIAAVKYEADPEDADFRFARRIAKAYREDTE